MSHRYDPRTNRSVSTGRRRGFRPTLELVEPRLLLATFTVTNISDTGTGSLRQAILSANSATNPAGDVDHIDFDIPGAGVQTITVASDLPALTDAVRIDGFSQPGASPNTNGPGHGDNAVLLIQIVPDAARLGSNGLLFTASGSTARGLVINGFTTGINLEGGNGTVSGNFIGTTPDGLSRGRPDYDNDAISVQSANNTIGGTAPADRNVLTSGGAAIHVPLNPFADASNNVIQGNFLGVDATGTNGIVSGYGIEIESGSSDQIGGSAAGAGNLIAGIQSDAIYVDIGGPDSYSRNSNGGHFIQGNSIGVDVTGTTLVPFTEFGSTRQGIGGDGIFIIGLYHGAPTVNPLPISIGGTAAGAGNVIAGASNDGIEIAYPVGFDAATTIDGNFIGTDSTGLLDLGNSGGGINVTDGVHNPTTISDNTIAFNAGSFNSGILIPGGETGIFITSNSIHDNALGNPGIQRTSSAGTAPPILTSSSTSGTTTRVLGTVAGAAGSTVRIEFFANPAPTQPISVQGQTLVDTLEVTIGSSGIGSIDASFPTVASEPLITATATSPGNTTSPFSDSAPAPTTESADLAVTAAGAPDPVVAGTNLTYTITVTDNGPNPALDARLTASVPDGTTFVSLATPQGWTTTTPDVGATGGITASTSSLGTDARAIFTLIVQVNPNASAGSTVSLGSAVTTSTTDPSSANNAASVATTVAGTTPAASTDLAVTAIAAPDPVLAGSNLTYTLVVKNHGPDAASGVSFSDVIPVNAHFVSFDAPLGWITTTPDPGSSGTVRASLPSLASDASATFTLVVEVDAGAVADSQILDTATTSATSEDPDSSNNATQTVTTIGASPLSVADLSIAATASSPAVTVGDNLTYTLTVTNHGPAAAPAVVLGDILPTGVTFVFASADQLIHPQLNGSTLSIPLGDLASGAAISLTLQVRSTATGTLTNDASVFSQLTDPDPGNNVATSITTATAAHTPQPGDGPMVTKFVRYGYHCHPTVLVLTFSSDLDAATATNRANYRIVGPGPDRRFGTKDDVKIGLRSIAYNPSTRTVVLYPRHRLDIHRRFQLTVSGTSIHGITNNAGIPLRANANGAAPGDYVAIIDRSKLVIVRR